MAVRFIRAMLASAPDLGVDKWTRARTALAACASTPTFTRAVAKCADKLEIHGALHPQWTVPDIAALKLVLGDRAMFGGWATWCRRNAVVAVAVASWEHREAVAAAKSAKKEKLGKPAAAAAVDGEPEF